MCYQASTDSPAVPGVSTHTIKAASGMKREVVGGIQKLSGTTGWIFNGSRRMEKQVGENGKDRKHSSSPKRIVALDLERFPEIKEKIAER